MKRSLGLMFTLLFSTNVFAHQFIIKNPKNLDQLQGLTGVNHLNTFKLGQNTYSVVQSDSLESLESQIAAESVFHDMEISLPEVEEGSELADNAWHVNELNYKNLPKISRDAKEVIVAVLDTGVDYNHDALKERMWINKDEVPGNNVDDDGNGYIDDVYGYDFVGKNDSDPMDTQGHGTHCAGIVAAKKQKEGNAQGIAPHVKLMAIRSLGSERKGFLSDAAESIKYSVDNGAHILTNSWRIYKKWASYYNVEGVKMLKEAIEYAESKGVIFVAAAGNERKDNDKLLVGKENADEIIPAGYTGLSNLFIVASSGKGKTASYFTNFGVESVAIAAPGSNIISTVPKNKWRSMSGTSMATPLVAGALARGLAAGMTAEQVLVNLKRSADKTDVWNDRVESGHINVMEFLK